MRINDYIFRILLKLKLFLLARPIFISNYSLLRYLFTAPPPSHTRTHRVFETIPTPLCHYGPLGSPSQRCREDNVLVEALPDTLELLLRACMEGLHLAGERAKKEAALRSRRSGNASSVSAVASAVSELEVARAVMSDSVYLAQLAPECFHEVIARVARKAEPERYALLFPLHFVSDDGQAKKSSPATEMRKETGGSGESFRAGGGREVISVGPSWGRWVHPTHLFHHCVSTGRLTTAAWFLPLVRDNIAYDAVQR